MDTTTHVYYCTRCKFTTDDQHRADQHVLFKECGAMSYTIHTVHQEVIFPLPKDQLNAEYGKVVS